ncbi:MAG: hypothetical protein QW587_05910, partial [Candidatus Bathyarchaeia archaeon]
AAVRLLRDCINRYGKPRQALTDWGAQLYPAWGGVSAFAECCRLNGVEHIAASPRRPSTLGKADAYRKAAWCEAPPVPYAGRLRPPLEPREAASRHKLLT